MSSSSFLGRFDRVFDLLFDSFLFPLDLDFDLLASLTSSSSLVYIDSEDEDDEESGLDSEDLLECYKKT